MKVQIHSLVESGLLGGLVTVEFEVVDVFEEAGAETDVLARSAELGSDGPGGVETASTT
jgi:hypothetical protein